MRSALPRALAFCLTGLLAVVAFEVLTFELPPKGGSIIWEQRLSLHVGLTVAIGLVALLGSLVGFALPSAGLRVTLKTAALFGLLFVVLAAVVIVPVAVSKGLMLGSLGAFLLAVALAWGGTRMVGRSAV
jgi:hypothetical protein